MSKWIIVDWMGNHCYRAKKFDSYEDARDFISEESYIHARKEKLVEGTQEHEDYIDGFCEDLYAEEVKEEDDY